MRFYNPKGKKNIYIYINAKEVVLLLLTETLRGLPVAVAVSSAAPAHVQVFAEAAAAAVHQLSAFRGSEFARVALSIRYIVTIRARRRRGP